MTTATKRILTELSIYHSTPSAFIDALAPSPENLLQLSAILSGRSLPPKTGYTRGRWLLTISIPTSYPNEPPQIKFVTKICHANVNWKTGELCLDVLQDRWTPVLGIVGALECVGRLLAEAGIESPLGIEVAALERQGDVVGKRALVGYWCDEERWDGDLEEIYGR